MELPTGNLYRSGCRRVSSRQQCFGKTSGTNTTHCRTGRAYSAGRRHPTGCSALLPGRGDSVGALLVNDARVRAVMFTGSTEVATILQRSIAGRLDPQGVQHR